MISLTAVIGGVIAVVAVAVVVIIVLAAIDEGGF